MTFKFMKAAEAKVDLSNVTVPMLASPKIDGFRMAVFGGVVYGANMKPTRNIHVQKMFGRKQLNGLDGELTAGPPNAPDVCRRTSSLALSFNNVDECSFNVFDVVHEKMTFIERQMAIREKVWSVEWASPVEQVPCNSVEGLVAAEEHFLRLGYEGLMLRAPHSLYKYGRATSREGTFFKLKRFADSEGIVIGFVEGQHNTNEATRDELGRKKRSSAKAGKVARGVLGSLIVVDIKTGIESRVKGFKAKDAEAWWAVRESLLGAVVTYKHFPHGVKDRVRHGNFKAFRSILDMTSVDVQAAARRGKALGFAKLVDRSQLM